MSVITVTTQAELDAALARTDLTYLDDEIVINSPANVRLELTDTRGLDVRASGSATVRASGSATVRAYGSATVHASDSATVHAYDSATVHAGDYVAVHLRSARATITGGVIIDATKINLTDPATWVDYTGAKVVDGEAILHKAVDDNLTAGHGWIPTTYSLGQTVTATDWTDDNHCGGGLHASPHPEQALTYAPSAARMVRVAVPLTDLRPILGGTAKAKSHAMRVIDEVQLSGQPLTTDQVPA